MCARLVVVADVFAKSPQQVLLVQWDDVISALSAERADDPFANWILPGTSVCRGCVFQTENSYLLLEVSTEYFIIISDDIFCGFIKSKGFTKLLNGPLRVRF